MFIALKTKIWITVLTIVLLFTFFTLYYFPEQQRQILLKNYNNEIQHLANTVALGVRIALTEQNYEGVQTAMEFVKDNPGLKFVSLLQTDTSWDEAHKRYSVQEKVFKTYPEEASVNRTKLSEGSVIVKRAPFETSLMSGAILLGFTTAQINESLREIRWKSLLVSGGIFLIGLLIGLWLSRSISIPVLALRDATIRVGKGDLTPIVSSNSHDEIGDLAIAFNNMVQDLAKAREELNSTNRELSDTNAALKSTLIDLQSTQAQLIQSEKMASLGELTAGIAHEIQNPLNFVNNFSEVNAELVDEMRQEMENSRMAEALEIANSIKENNCKISEHGKRADSIVKNMLQHSRKSTGLKEPVDLNSMIDEYMHLSYHGLRAKDKSFNATMQTDLDENVGMVKVVPQEMGRVLLNLFNNAFYSLNEKQKKVTDGYKPCLLVSTRKKSGKVEISIRDNGLGISQKVIDKIFQPFFTTKSSGQGTGLGLSISYDIISKEHGGVIKVDSKEGEFAEFDLEIPA
jgi:two-component system, NtrC family, sensor kinase